MTSALQRLRRLLGRGLQETQPLWSDIRTAYEWVHQAAHILGNDEALTAEQVEHRFDELITMMAAHRDQAGTLAAAIDHFMKVTASYRPGLFHCYRVPNLPGTNNDLEHVFGGHRHHDRRATGRKTASPTLVLHGPTRLIAAAATRARRFTARDLARVDRGQYAMTRHLLEHRRHGRVLRTRFRRNPDGYLADLEARLDQLVLPP